MYNALALKKFCGYNDLQIQNYIVDTLGSDYGSVMLETMEQANSMNNDEQVIPKKIAQKICPLNTKEEVVEDDAGNATLPYVGISETSYKIPWEQKWNVVISDSIDKYGTNLLNANISEEDLNKVECPGFNSATNDEKKVFWSLFFASMAKGESGYRKDPHNGMKDPIGILQLDIGIKRHGKACAAENDASMNNTERRAWIADYENNIQCSVQVMHNQLEGWAGRRNDVKGRLFPGPKHFYWDVLTNKRGETQDWFLQHKRDPANAGLLDFCNK